MNLPLFNIETIINENIYKNTKGNPQNKKISNSIQTQTIYDKGYKEIMKKKYEFKHSSILSTNNITNSNNNSNNNPNLKNNNQNKYIIINQSNCSGGYRDNLNANNYTSNKRKRIYQNKSSKLIEINQTFSNFNYIEEISTSNKKAEKKIIMEQSPNKYNMNEHKNTITINNLDSNSSINKMFHKRNIKEKNLIFNDPIKTINKIYSYINTSKANKKKTINNNKKRFYNIFNSKFFEDNKKTIITDRYLNNNKEFKNKNISFNKNNKEINFTFNSIILFKSKSKDKKSNKKVKESKSNKSKYIKNAEKLKSSISFYKKIGKIDNKLFYNKFKRKNNKVSSILKWNYNKSIDYKNNSSNLNKNKSNISNSRNNPRNNDLIIIKRNKTLNIYNDSNSNLNNKLYIRQKNDLQYFKSDFDIKQKKYNNIIDIFSNQKSKDKNNINYIDNNNELKNNNIENEMKLEAEKAFNNAKKKEIIHKNSKKSNKNYIDFVKYCKNYLNEDKNSKKRKKSKNLLIPPLNLNNDFNKESKIEKIKTTNFVNNKFKSTDYTSESKSKSKSKKIETENKNKFNSYIIKKKRNYIYYNNYNKNSNKSSFLNIFDISNLFKNKNIDLNINHNHSALNIIRRKNINKNINNSSAIINITNPFNNYSNNSNFIFNNYNNISLIKTLNDSKFSFRENKNSNSFSKKYESNLNYEVKEGNYIFKRGELILNRYEIIKILGKGSFGICYKSYDKKNNEYVCLKILNNSPNSIEQYKSEINILKVLNNDIIRRSGHFIKMKNFFNFKGYICIVFELLSINLFEEIQNSNFVGFDLSTILRFSIQLLFGLLILKNKNIIHCDLKPENILLVKKGKTGIKIIDFGSSCYINQAQYEYIQSRYYRAPEVILGLDYGCEIDMWSLGCILCELYCGIPIFPGENEYDILYYIMEYIGMPPKELIEKSRKKLEFFNEDGSPLEKKNSMGKIRRPNKKSIEAFLINADKDFIDLIQNILKWKKEERFNPEQALKHKWIIKNLTKEGLDLHFLKIKEYSSLKEGNEDILSKNVFNYDNINELNKENKFHLKEIKENENDFKKKSFSINNSINLSDNIFKTKNKITKNKKRNNYSSFILEEPNYFSLNKNKKK